MRFVRHAILAMATCLVLGVAASEVSATDWSRFYHYPYSYFPQNYRAPYQSADFDTGTQGYPSYPANMAFPPYYRTDLYYPYWHGHYKPGGTRKSRYQGNHYILDVF